MRTLFYQGGLIDTEAVERAVRERGGHHHLERVFAGASWGVAGAFFLSAALNFLLASTLVTADPGTDVYNEQLGRLTALSFPAIALPTTLALVGALWFLLRGLSRLSGLPLEALVRNPRREEEP
ncbi:MAG: hypothetical protein KatS3mg124_1112 [Porticoccaceae bacterium]|nr:MAG: hypothetical protein KatS3mg124_1112 [Porticoccaceae bacterium]